MSDKPHKRQPGEFEIRILRDGRVIMIAPDEKLLELAQELDPDNAVRMSETENQENARIQNDTEPKNS